MTETPSDGGDRPIPRSQTDVVVQDIRAMIVNGDLRAGSRLPIEADLAATLGVSRSSLREGVRALAALGVLETRQGDGTYVTSLDASRLLTPIGFLVDLQPSSNASDLTVVRRVLEVEAAARAASRMNTAQLDAAQRILDDVAVVIGSPTDDDHEQIMEADRAFHRVIASAADNAVMEALIEALGSRTMRTRIWRSVTEQGAEARTHEQHLEILRAIAAKDPDRARSAMSFHLFQVEDFAASHGDAPPEL